METKNHYRVRMRAKVCTKRNTNGVDGDYVATAFIGREETQSLPVVWVQVGCQGIHC